jgi:hypothetical protein
MRAQKVASTLWALAKLGWQAEDGAMRSALEGAAVRVAPSMNAQDVASTLWAAATLGWQGAMQSALEGAMVRVASSMSAQNVADTFWALATLGWKACANNELAAGCAQLVAALSFNCKHLELSTASLSQLLQAHLASQFLRLGLIALPSVTLQVALKAYKEEARKVTAPSSQREVAESLQRLGIPYELEYVTVDGLFSIDLAIVDRRIAIEFDGPSRFTTNTLEPLGHTRLRDRLLSAMGWHVVSIPCFVWEQLPEPDQRDAYLELRVQPSASSEPSSAQAAASPDSAPPTGMALLQASDAASTEERNSTVFAAIENLDVTAFIITSSRTSTRPVRGSHPDSSFVAASLAALPTWMRISSASE